MTFLIALFARWSVPEAIRRPLALATTIIAVAGMCGLLWTCWLRSHDKAVIADHELEVQAGIATASASASAAATEAVTETRTKVEQANERARDAASGSADPLKSGFDSLRRDNR